MTKHLDALISRQENAFISSIDANGFPVVKIVNAPRLREGLKVMYFTTPQTSQAVADYKVNSHASVYFADKSRFQTASFTGVMEIVEDEAIRNVLKAEEHAKIFNGKVIDEDYCVLKFTASDVRFFTNGETSTQSIK